MQIDEYSMHAVTGGSAPAPAALAPYIDEIVAGSQGDLPPIAFIDLDPFIAPRTRR